jgi:hypothetical protein
MLATLASLTLAVVVQDQTPLRAAPAAAATTHAQLLQGDVVEVRAAKLDHVQVWDHRRERAGYVRATQLRALPADEAQAQQAQAVWRFLRDTPGQESLGIAYVAAYLKALPPKAHTAEPYEALGAMAERLAQRASQAASARQASAAAHLDVVAPFGVKFQSFDHRGAVRLCYQGDAFAQVLAMPADAAQKALAALALTRHECVAAELAPADLRQLNGWRAETLDALDRKALPADLANRVQMRRAGVWSAIAYQQARAGQSAQTAVQTALDAFASVHKTRLTDDDAVAYQEAALRLGAVRHALAAAVPGNVSGAARAQLRFEPGEPGQTCVRVANAATTLLRRCTWGVVWANSTRTALNGRAIALAVQPTATWTELWLFQQAADGAWRVDVLPPAATAEPGIGYAEWAGFVPGRDKVLVAREAIAEGIKPLRRFEVLALDTLAVERWADTPQVLAGFRWQSPVWKAQTVAMR